MSYKDIYRRKSPSPLGIQKGQFSNDSHFYQELSQKLWESKPSDENCMMDVPMMKTKRATAYLNDENGKDLVAENRKLKETIIQLKLEMKSKLEADLMKQKNEFQGILSEYVEFIDKLLQDKKELQQQLDQMSSVDDSATLKHQVTSLQQEQSKSLQQSEEFHHKLQQIENLLTSLEEEKQHAYGKIDKLKMQNIELKQYYEERIQQIKQSNYNDLQKFEQIVQSTIDKKDQKINKLKEELLHYQQQQ